MKPLLPAHLILAAQPIVLTQDALNVFLDSTADDFDLVGLVHDCTEVGEFRPKWLPET
jgi:hypothetical protein